MRRKIVRSAGARKIPIGVILVAGLTIGLASQAMWLGGCASPLVRAAKHASVACGKEYAPQVAAAVAEYGAKAILAGHVDWSEVEKEAVALGVEVGGCAAKELVAALTKVPRVQAIAMGGEPDVVAQGQAMLERLRVHWDVSDWSVQ